MKYSDHPITHPSEDVLGRTKFALDLAQAIDKLNARNGFVIGVVGEWGSGKSSVIELTLRFLRHIEMAGISHIPFVHEHTEDRCTPDQIENMAHLYEEVEHHIEEMVSNNLDLTLWQRTHRERRFADWLGTHEKGKIAYRYWRLRQRVELHPKNIIVRFSPWLIAGRAELASALLSDIARVSGERINDDVRQAFAALLGRLSEFAPLAGATLDLSTSGPIGGFLSAGTELAATKLAKYLTLGPTLDEVRQHLRSTLAKLEDQKLVIVIDDLDRLTPAEAVEMASLVKSLGDLPNVVYLLSFDQERLASLISQAIGLDGAEFLEKIIQHSYHLPPLDETDVSQLVDSDLQAILPRLNQEDSKRMSEAWYYVIRKYIKTPRDAKRLVNSFSMAWSSLSDFTDPVDLLLVETMKLHEYNIYTWLRQNYSDLVA